MEETKFNAIVLGIIYNPAEKKILIGRRENDKEMPNLTWCFPGGRLLPGDEVDETLKRKIKEKTGYNDAIRTVVGEIGGYKTAIGIMDFSFIGGSMGSVVGEKISRLVSYAISNKTPLIIVSASGGARMQEGSYSLMQMAKTSAMVAKFSKEKGLFISILTVPTTGGTTASFAMLGDIILAEPKALIGFAGPRVIEQTINQKLPEGFQRSEFLQEKGFVDKVVHRDVLKDTLGKLLLFHRRYQ